MPRVHNATYEFFLKKNKLNFSKKNKDYIILHKVLQLLIKDFKNNNKNIKISKKKKSNKNLNKKR